MEEASEAVFHSPFFFWPRQDRFSVAVILMDGDFIGDAKMGHRQGGNCATFVLVVGGSCIWSLITCLVVSDLRRACAAAIPAGA